MGTIAAKLTYLNTTKIKLRDSLNKFGSSILSTDTFRSYDTKLNDIYDKLPKVTQSGAGFTLFDVQNGQVDDFKMIGTDLEQNGTPTPDNPQDIKVVEGRQVITDKGKNKLNIPDGTYSNNGVTAVVKDGVVTLNGTTGSGNSFIRFPFVFEFEDTKTYTLSANNEEIIGGNSSEVVFCSLRFEENVEGTSNINTWCYLGTKNNSKTINMNYNVIKFCIRTGAGLTYNNFVIKPQLEENPTATDYEPYYNPVGYNIDLTNDLLKYSKCDFTPTTTSWYFLDSSGSAYGSNIGTKTNIKFPVEINKKYTFRYNISTEFNSFQLCYENENIVATLDKSSGNKSFTFTSNRNGYVIPRVLVQANSQVKITDISVVEGEEDYYDYKLAKIPNTDYKNRIYKNNGNWYYEENAKMFVLDGSEDENWGTFKNSMILIDLWNNNPTIMCDYFKPTTNSIWVSDDDSYRGMCSSLNTAGQFRCMPLTNMTLAEFKTWLSTHNVIVWYELQNPVTTQITNTTLINQLEAISVHTGTNIITISNDNNIIPEIEITRLKELEKLS